MFSPSQALAGDLMLHCERCMQSAANTHEADTIRQSIVVLMGTLAKHMEKENPKVRERQSCTQAHFLFPLLRRAWVRGWWRIDSHLQLQYSPPSCLYLQVKSVVHLLLSSLDTPSQQVSSWGCGLWSHDMSCDPSSTGAGSHCKLPPSTCQCHQV